MRRVESVAVDCAGTHAGSHVPVKALRRGMVFCLGWGERAEVVVGCWRRRRRRWWEEEEDQFYCFNKKVVPCTATYLSSYLHPIFTLLYPLSLYAAAGPAAEFFDLASKLASVASWTCVI